MPGTKSLRSSVTSKQSSKPERQKPKSYLAPQPQPAKMPNSQNLKQPKKAPNSPTSPVKSNDLVSPSHPHPYDDHQYGIEEVTKSHPSYPPQKAYRTRRIGWVSRLMCFCTSCEHRTYTGSLQNPVADLEDLRRHQSEVLVNSERLLWRLSDGDR